MKKNSGWVTRHIFWCKQTGVDTRTFYLNFKKPLRLLTKYFLEIFCRYLRNVNYSNWKHVLMWKMVEKFQISKNRYSYTYFWWNCIEVFADVMERLIILTDNTCLCKIALKFSNFQKPLHVNKFLEELYRNFCRYHGKVNYINWKHVLMKKSKIFKFSKTVTHNRDFNLYNF